MRENLERALAEIFSHEGGYSSIRSDPGNWTGGQVGVGQLKGTKYGIAANSYPHLDIPNLTLAQAAEIYRRDYWNKINGDTLFPGVDLAAFDLAVNSGVGRVRQLLPRAIGSDNHAETVKRLCALRLAFMRSLSTWGTFGKGWSRRVARIEAVGVAWALAAMGKPSTQVKAELGREADKAKTSAAKDAAGAGAAGAGSAATVGGASALDPSSFDWSAWLFVSVLVALGAALAVFLIRRALRNRERAEAYSEAAKGV